MEVVAGRTLAVAERVFARLELVAGLGHRPIALSVVGLIADR
jgi:hypothetical protein